MLACAGNKTLHQVEYLEKLFSGVASHDNHDIQGTSGVGWQYAKSMITQYNKRSPFRVHKAQ